VTHDMVSCYHIADRVALLNEGRVHFYGTVEELKRTTDPVILILWMDAQDRSRLKERYDHEFRKSHANPGRIFHAAGAGRHLRDGVYFGRSATG